MLGRQMLSVAIGWEVYERTHSALALGYIGLVQLLPVVLLVLPAGHIVDTRDRRKVLITAQWVNALATAGLAYTSLFAGPVWLMYAWLIVVGIGNAFHRPANAALLPQVVSPANFTHAVTWSSILFQMASILGPALGGIVIGIFHHAHLVYLTDCMCCILFALILLMVKSRKQEVIKKEMNLKTLASGLSYVWETKIILAAITLDMFAVLFGGAIALLPIFARDILKVGPSGLGWLQTAPSLGAIATGLILARQRGGIRKAGAWLMLTVIGFGLATIGFGLSRNFWLSFGMLFLTGVFDNVSVIIRQALVQLRTPDDMRGRVSAINYVFIGTSNELGGFESGLVAQWLGPIFSVVFGGIATIMTVLFIGGLWPALRTMDRLDEDRPPEENRLGDAG
jgi:MFS family permease